MPRKLLLQMHMSLDGYVAGPNKSLDWITTDWSQDLKDIVSSITSNVDEILLGRRLAEDFIPAWRSRPADEAGVAFMNSTPKTVFSSTWEIGAPDDHVKVARGPVEYNVRRLKEQEGKDMIVYGGVEVVQPLVKAGLIDDFFLLIEPVVLGFGRVLFTDRKKLDLVDATKTDCGVTVLHYRLQD